MVKVIGIGVACLDYLLQAPDIRRVHEGGRLRGFRIQGGGMAATAMVAVARLGGQAELWTALGDDLHGQWIAAELAYEGVDLSQTARVPGRASPFNFVMVDGVTGERVFLSPGIGWEREWPGTPVAWERLDAADALLVDGFWPTLALEALRRARARGIPTCGDINRVAGNEELLPLIDYLVASRHVAEEIAGGASEQALRALARGGARLTAITLGEQGLIYLADGELGEMPAFSAPVVDTTGAGDVFHGALAFGVAQGWAPRPLLRFASAVAALKCRALGGRTACPTRAEVEAFLAQHR